MELSALLTKKAALIGGGTAATTTAVVVPIAVTQSKKEEGAKSPSSSGSQEGQGTHSQQQDQSEDETPEAPSLDSLAQLDLSGDNFYDNFNNPGYCVRKLFPGIEKTSFFNKPNEYPEGPDSVTKTDLFASEDFSNGCYTYNKQTKPSEKVRIELTAQGPTEGWIWMSGLKPDGGNKKLFYREAYLKKEGDKWSVITGQEGEIGKEGAYTPAFPQFATTNNANNKFNNVKDINPTNREECTGNPATNCPDTIARVGYWVNKPDSGDMYMQTDQTASGNHITRWSGQKTKLWNPSNRKKIFLNNKWHNNNSSLTEQGKAQLFDVANDKLPCKKGNWKDLNALCKQTENKDAEFNIYCQ